MTWHKLSLFLPAARALPAGSERGPVGARRGRLRGTGGLWVLPGPLTEAAAALAAAGSQQPGAAHAAGRGGPGTTGVPVPGQGPPPARSAGCRWQPCPAAGPA